MMVASRLKDLRESIRRVFPTGPRPLITTSPVFIFHNELTLCRISYLLFSNSTCGFIGYISISFQAIFQWIYLIRTVQDSAFVTLNNIAFDLTNEICILNVYIYQLRLYVFRFNIITRYERPYSQPRIEQQLFTFVLKYSPLSYILWQSDKKKKKGVVTCLFQMCECNATNPSNIYGKTRIIYLLLFLKGFRCQCTCSALLW